MNRFFETLGRLVVRFRWAIVIAWLLGAVAAVSLLPSLASQVNDNNGAFLPASAPSNEAAVLAEPLIGSVNHLNITIVVVTTKPHLGTGDDAAVAAMLGRLKRVPTAIGAHFLGALPGRSSGRPSLHVNGLPLQRRQVTHRGERRGPSARDLRSPERGARLSGRAGCHRSRQSTAIRPSEQGDTRRLRALHHSLAPADLSLRPRSLHHVGARCVWFS